MNRKIISTLLISTLLIAILALTNHASAFAATQETCPAPVYVNDLGAVLADALGTTSAANASACPRMIYVDGQGNKYIGAIGVVEKFDANGKLLAQYKQTKLVCVGPIYVNSLGDVLSVALGKPGKITCITLIYVDGQGNKYVGTLGQVNAYDVKGNLVTTYKAK